MAPSCTATITAVSVAMPAPLKSCRNTVANVSTANCGQHSRPIATAARHTLASRRGLDGGVAGLWPADSEEAVRALPPAPVATTRRARSGSRSHPSVSSAAPAHRPASRPNTAPKPARDASHGSTSAPRPPPSGTAVWRMLIARPRSPSSNHAITARPLAPLTLPPITPTSSRPSASSHKAGATPWAGAAPRLIQASAAAVAPRPANSTGRSPQRSASRPQGSSNNATPRPSTPSARPSASLSSR
ncbi:hypothetical protein LMG26845_05255 [Achromobacter insuavis]|uniref:Uncharacterized protein n=1 Tax=Achromobacter insuavis TaxID=1287735 RepID=A0A6J5BED4_9BURK|nr:hypothetical protein LMG26845_05255 [Achromobacter insuavis]